MLRMGRNAVVFSGSMTWSAGETMTASKSLSTTASITLGQTTLLHEVIFSHNYSTNFAADLRPGFSIGGSMVVGDYGWNDIAISAVATVKGYSRAATSVIVDRLFNGAYEIIAVSFQSAITTALTGTATVNCIIREFEGPTK